VTGALAIGAALMLVALGLLRASQLSGPRPDPMLLRRRRWLRRAGLVGVALAFAVTGALGGTRAAVLLLAASAIGGWALAMTGSPVTDGDRRPSKPP
jgi:hypothetical protein